MNQRRCRRHVPAHRRAMASLELVMTIAVMLPIVGTMLFLGVQMCITIYHAIAALVSWPFL